MERQIFSEVVLRIKSLRTPGLVDETIEHVLMECSKYEVERETLISKMRELGEQEITVKSLLRLENRKQMRVLSEFLRAMGLCDRI